MEIAADALPEDLEALRAMVLGLQQKLAQSDQILSLIHISEPTRPY